MLIVLNDMRSTHTTDANDRSIVIDVLRTPGLLLRSRNPTGNSKSILLLVNFQLFLSDVFMYLLDTVLISNVKKFKQALLKSS